MKRMSLTRAVKRLWQPPRTHGETVENRSVSFLELFYDLVYVVLIAAAAHNLADDLRWEAVGEFIVVFSLVWIAWVNGTAHHDLHGRDDIRTRTFTFAQMLLIALMAVYAADGEHGRDEFSIVYGMLFALLAWLWYRVHLRTDEKNRRMSLAYVVVVLLTGITMLSSSFAPSSVQFWLWTAVVLGWLCSVFVVSRATAASSEDALVADSFVERFGLFTIIVLGEVVVGVVDGISNSERTLATVATGMLTLGIGFGLWWIYFDLVGRRLPLAGPNGLPVWMMLHLPLTMAITAAGATMVAVIEHAHDGRTPEVAVWMLGGSVAVAFLTIAAMVRTLADWRRRRTIYLPTAMSMVVLAAGCVALGLLHPPTIVLSSALLAFLTLAWLVAVWRWSATENDFE